MKRILLPLILVGAFQANSQVNFGAKLGASFYHFTGPDAKKSESGYDSKLKPGFVVGPFVEIPINEIFSLQPSLLYSQEGETRSTVHYNVSYLNIPVMLQYKHESGFFAETGPQISFFLSAPKIESEKFFKKTVMAWTLGAGWEFENGFGVNARSHFGLTSIQSIADERKTSSGFYLAATYTFRTPE